MSDAVTSIDVRRIAKTFGILFLLTWITGIAGRVLLAPVYSDSLFVLGEGAGTGIYLGAVFEFLLIFANIATAVVLYPIAKRFSEIGAVGYVTARIVECVFILVGLLSLLTIVTLGQDLAGASGPDAVSLATAGRSLTATYEWAFLFGPGLTAGVGNGLILGYVMYRSGLVPRRLATLGLVGGSVHVIGFLGVLFGAFEAGSAFQLLFTAPEIVWEAALPVYVLRKGFKTGDALKELGDVFAQHAERSGGNVELARDLPQRAPIIIAVIERRIGDLHVPEIEDYHAIGAAMQNVLLAAHADGLVAMTRTGPYARLPEVHEHLGLSAGELIAGFIYVGFPLQGFNKKAPRKTPVTSLTEWRGFEETALTVLAEEG